jgi:hypothetical protein
VPDDLPDEVAVLTEIMSVTHGVETALAVVGMNGGNRFGGSVAVLGSGPLGLCHLIKAKLLGAATLIATDRFKSRLAMAEAFRRRPSLPWMRRIRPSRWRACANCQRTRRRHRALLQQLSRDLRRGSPDGAGGRRRGRGGNLRRHGAGSDQSELRYLHQERRGARVGGETATSYLPSMRLMAANLKRMPLEQFVSHRMRLIRRRKRWNSRRLTRRSRS